MIIREYDDCDNSIKLTEEEKRVTFYHAITKKYPLNATANMIQKYINNSEILLDEMNTCIIQLQNEHNQIQQNQRKTLGTSQAKVAMTKYQRQASNSNTKCNRSNKFGHRSNACPLRAYGLWYYFYC